MASRTIKLCFHKGLPGNLTHQVACLGLLLWIKISVERRSTVKFPLRLKIGLPYWIRGKI